MASKKPAAERKVTHMTMIATDAERELFSRAAKLTGQNRTQWAMAILRKAANTQISDATATGVAGS